MFPKIFIAKANQKMEIHGRKQQQQFIQKESLRVGEGNKELRGLGH
jgi:hypothetical protein